MPSDLYFIIHHVIIISPPFGSILGWLLAKAFFPRRYINIECTEAFQYHETSLGLIIIMCFTAKGIIFFLAANNMCALYLFHCAKEHCYHFYRKVLSRYGPHFKTGSVLDKLN